MDEQTIWIRQDCWKHRSFLLPDAIRQIGKRYCMLHLLRAYCISSHLILDLPQSRRQGSRLPGGHPLRCRQHPTSRFRRRRHGDVALCHPYFMIKRAPCPPECQVEPRAACGQHDQPVPVYLDLDFCRVSIDYCLPWNNHTRLDDLLAKEPWIADAGSVAMQSLAFLTPTPSSGRSKVSTRMLLSCPLRVPWRAC